MEDRTQLGFSSFTEIRNQRLKFRDADVSGVCGAGLLVGKELCRKGAPEISGGTSLSQWLKKNKLSMQGRDFTKPGNKQYLGSYDLDCWSETKELWQDRMGRFSRHSRGTLEILCLSNKPMFPLPSKKAQKQDREGK